MFFLMAGFFGAHLLRRWGVARFARDRLRRIGIPLAVGVFAIVPLAAPILHAVRPELPPPGVPGYLWFLWYVLVLYGVAIVLLRAPWIDRVSAATARLAASPLAVPLLAAATAVLFFSARHLSVGAASWLVPRPQLLAFYGSFFVVGVLLHGTPEGVDAGGRRPWLTGAIALAALVSLVLLDPTSVWQGSSVMAPGRTRGWLALLCVFNWAAVLCVCGVGKRLLAAERPAVRYIADSSYWIFLMHVPLVPLAITFGDIARPALPRVVARGHGAAVLLPPDHLRAVRQAHLHRPHPQRPATTPAVGHDRPPTRPRAGGRERVTRPGRLPLLALAAAATLAPAQAQAASSADDSTPRASARLTACAKKGGALRVAKKCRRGERRFRLLAEPAPRGPKGDAGATGPRRHRGLRARPGPRGRDLQRRHRP